MKKLSIIIGLAACMLPSLAVAQDATATPVNPEVVFILNTLLFLFCGVLVMFMAAGFAMLEAGMVRSSSVATIILKNISRKIQVVHAAISVRQILQNMNGHPSKSRKCWVRSNGSITVERKLPRRIRNVAVLLKRIEIRDEVLAVPVHK